MFKFIVILFSAIKEPMTCCIWNKLFSNKREL